MLVARDPHYYDAVLMDIKMPVMDGYTATKNIRAMDDRELAAIPVIALTANAFAEDQLAAERAGMQAYIAKPIEVDKMMRTLADVLGLKEVKESDIERLEEE